MNTEIPAWLFDYWILLVPVILLQVILMITALVQVLKQELFRFGNKVFWIIVVAAIQIVGPIAYFAFGKED
ncbi:PLDc N-terminal domain-containing protein [Marinilactibacillus sp. Marseille-P9653]|uniref:PLDc N-terminal domain-containing protein n=1 Tax=Marinilactibacillus sp. Marseille-P9653 TaxID=2866583 RepID=UPI001CE4701C|nr:PLDc N-terminal domain-containing protein [Marinilactibacillus sp. Marseille-P9653]